jgi:acetyl-CoA carboxylase alpha subunit
LLNDFSLGKFGKEIILMNPSTLSYLSKLEVQLEQLIEKIQQLQNSNLETENILSLTISKLDKKNDDAKYWKEKYKALKAIQGINSSNTAAKKRTLHHIDVLVSEIDACIAQIQIDN